MKKILILICFAIISCNCLYAQIATPSDIYISGSGRTRTPQEIEAMKRVYDNELSNAKFRRLQSTSPSNNSSNSYYTSVDLYPANLVSMAKKHINPNKTFREQYKNFLKLKNTGIVKILTEKACTADEPMKNVSLPKIVEKCPFNFINGGGKYFSFRRNEYVHSKLADIGIQEDWIFSLGLFNQGILVKLGDIPIEDVSLSNAGIGYLNQFVPRSNIEDIDKQYAVFEKGIVVGNFTYQKIIPAEIGKTYGLRVAAYNVEQFYEAKNDVRQDVVIAFRIIDKDDEGNTTLVWKELQRIAAPKLIIEKSEKSK